MEILLGVRWLAIRINFRNYGKWIEKIDKSAKREEKKFESRGTRGVIDNGDFGEDFRRAFVREGN